MPGVDSAALLRREGVGWLQWMDVGEWSFGARELNRVVVYGRVVGVGNSGGEAVQGVDRLKRLEVGLVHSWQVLGDGGFLVFNSEGAARVRAVKY